MAYNMYVCPNCRKVFKINGPGKKAKCPKCQDPILVDTGAVEEDWKTYSPDKKNSIISHLLDEPEVIEIVEPVAPEPTATSQPDDSFASLFDFDDNQSVANSPSPAPAPASKSFFDDPNMDMGSSSSTGGSFFDNSSMDVQPTQPQIIYTPPPVSPGGKNSKLSIIAFILSITGCLFIVGLILAIIDLKNKDDGFKHSFSYTSLVICGLWLILSVAVKALGGGSSNKSDVADTSSSIETSAEDSNSETISIENDNAESSDGVTMPDLVGMSLEDASRALMDNELTAKASYVSSDAPKDSIVGQNVAAGDTIERHSVVTLEVSSGDSAVEDSTSEESTPSEPEAPKEPDIPKDEYIASCEELNYKAIARNPEQYEGKHFVYTGMISSAREGGLFTGYQKYYISYAFDESKAQDMINQGWAKNMDDAKIYGMDYDTSVWLLDNRDPSSPDYVKILEDDVVKVYGTFTGMQGTKNSLTGESGEEVSLDIKYVELLFE